LIVKSKKSVLSNVVFDQKCKQNQEHIKLHLKRIYAFLNDQKHFRKTYQQVNRRLKQGSLVVFDKGAHSIGNTVLYILFNKEWKLSNLGYKMIGKLKPNSTNFQQDGDP
jgi:hypothetical protein